MNRRERCMKALAGGVPDRPPISFDWSHDNIENREAVYRHYGADDKNDLYRAAGIDGFSVWEWNAVMGEYRGALKIGAQGEHLDFWGNYYPGYFGLFECDSVESLAHHTWPRVSDFDFSGIYPQACRIRSMDMVVAAGHIGIGYQMHNMLRGNEKSLFDVCDERYMHAYMEHIAEFTCGYLEGLLAGGKGLIDVVRADEDMGTMERLMISPEMWRRYYKPVWKRAFDIVHRWGAKVWLHSCGYIMPLMEDFIEIGVDCWNPFPPYVKDNAHETLTRFRKGRLVLDGGVNQLVLVNGKPADVRDATKKVLDLFAADGGLLIGPSQVLTADMPAENIIAMFETAMATK